MAKLKIVTGKDNPILRAMSTPVKKFDAGLKKFVKELKEAMVKAKGLGIAAPQVGQNIRVFITVLNYKTPQQVTVTMVNPEIIEHSLETNIDEEGCLSLPGVYGKVERFNKVVVKFFDLDGNEQIFKLENLNARVVQHENDHINGVLFIDRIAEQEERKKLAV